MSSAREMESEHLVQVYGQLPVEPVAGEGVMLYTRDGRELIDFYGGHAVASLGYGHPRLLKALNSQAKQMLFQSNAVALEQRARAANRLVQFANLGLPKVFFANSGAEANENALRIALAFTGRKKVVALEHGFHGRSAGAAAVTWGSKRWYGFPRTPFDVEFIPREGPLSPVIDETVAAVILEPVQGVAGAYDLNTDFVGEISSRCNEVGALVIADEVQTGMGRMGAAFACNELPIRPDMLTTAKALAGGFPCSALMLREDIAEQLGVGDLGTTFGGGPMAAALIHRTIDIIEEEGLLENVQRQSRLIREICGVGPVTGFQGKGFLMGLRTNEPASVVRDALLDKGILVGTSADPNVIRLLPPLTLAREHVEQLARTLKEVG